MQTNNKFISHFFKFKAILLLCCVLLQFNGGNANTIIDSLKGVINSPSVHDTIKVRTLFELSNYYYLGRPDTTIIICEEALAISKKNNYTYGMAEGYGWIGYLLQQKGQTAKAVEYYNKNLTLAESINDLNGVAVASNNLAYVYQQQGDIRTALFYYNKSLETHKKNNNLNGVATSFINLGALYDDQGDKEIALEYYQKSLPTLKKLGDKSTTATALNNIGYIYDMKGKDSIALWYYNENLSIVKELGDIHRLASVYVNIGYVYSKRGDINEAIKFYRNGLRLQEQVGNKKGIIRASNNLAGILLERGETKEALSLLERSLEYSKELGFPRFISSSAVLLSQIYEMQGKYNSALNLFKLHVQMKDSLHNMESQKATVQQRAKYEYEKQKAVDDAEHDKEIAIEQEAKEKQTILTYATAGGLGLVAIFLLVVFNRLKVTRKQKSIIEEQKTEVEKQKSVVELAHTELEEKNKEITDSIQYAKRIQNAILPPNKVVKEYLQESFIYYKPKDIVAGDFYWLEHSKNKVLFAAADCTGHGVPGAMVSVVCNNGLNRSVREFGLTDPGEILNRTREIVVQEFEKSEEEVKDGMDIALCSLEGNKLQYAGAHNPLWLIRDGELIETKANKQPIGQFDNPEPYTTHTLELKKGDSLYIFSDGYADQFGGEKGKKLKTANFKKLLLSIQKESMEKQKQLIDEAFEHWRGDLEQLDDVCVIGVRI